MMQSFLCTAQCPSLGGGPQGQRRDRGRWDATSSLMCSATASSGCVERMALDRTTAPSKAATIVVDNDCATSVLIPSALNRSDSISAHIEYASAAAAAASGASSRLHAAARTGHPPS